MASASEDLERTARTLVNEGIVPNASNAYKCDNMVYHPSYGMLVRNHGISQTFVSQDVNTPDYISSLKGLEWSPMSPAFRYPSPMFEQWNPKGIAVDPRNPDHVYSGSVLHGLMRLDLANPSNSLRLSRDNDPAKSETDWLLCSPHSRNLRLPVRFQRQHSMITAICGRPGGISISGKGARLRGDMVLDS